MPFWLQPEKHYAGVAWYQRDLDIPADWKGKRVLLTLERPHWETRLWVDGREAGSNNSLSTPHEYDLGTTLQPGKHQLTIRVDNSLVVDVGVNSHCISDHTQGNWNGIVGDIGLRVTAPVWVEDLQVYPHLAAKSVTVKGKIGNALEQGGRGEVTLVCDRTDLNTDRNRIQQTIPVTWSRAGGEFQAELLLGEHAAPWDEFSKVLYLLNAALAGSETSKSAVFGLREVSTEGTQFVLNGRKIFILSLIHI